MPDFLVSSVEGHAVGWVERSDTHLPGREIFAT